MARPWTARDCYPLRRDEGGRLVCRRVRGEAREVPVIAVGGATEFDTGPTAGAAGRVLAVSVLADLLEASPRAEDYETLAGTEGWAWDLHRACFARWLQGLRVEPGTWREVDARALAAWVIEEMRARSSAE